MHHGVVLCGVALPLFCSLAKKFTSMMFLVVDVVDLAVSNALNSSLSCKGTAPLLVYMCMKI